MSSLSGLGYVGGDTTAGVSDLEQYHFWNAKDNLLMQHTSGEIVDAILHQNFKQASLVLLTFMEQKPELEKMLMNLIRIRMRTLQESKYLSTPIDEHILRKFYRRFNKHYPDVLTLQVPKKQISTEIEDSPQIQK